MRMVELWMQWGRRARPILLRLSLIGLGSAAATLLNPYSLHLHRWLLSALQIPRPEITEWHGLEFQESFTWLFLALVAAFAWGLAKERRQLDATRLLVLAIVLLQATQHRRHIAFAAILGGLWLPLLWQQIWVSAKSRWMVAHQVTLGQAVRDSAPARWFTAAVLIGCLGLLTVTVYKTSRIEVRRDQYPVDAVAFMAEHQLDGRLVVAFNWAQYVLAAASSTESGLQATRVAFDGRFRTCYPQAIIDMHFDLLLGNVPGQRFRGAGSPPFEPARMLNWKEPDLALLDRKQPHSVQTIQQHSAEWALLYQDGICQLWGRRSRFDSRDSADYLPPDQRVVHNQTSKGGAAWPAFPSPDVPLTNIAISQPSTTATQVRYTSATGLSEEAAAPGEDVRP